MWLESMGVVSGCSCKEVYRFPHITYPYSSEASLLFVLFKNVFRSLIILGEPNCMKNVFQHQMYAPREVKNRDLTFFFFLLLSSVDLAR